MTDNAVMQDGALTLEQRLTAKYRARVRDWRLSTIHVNRRWRYTRERQGLRALLREWHKRAGLFAFAFMAWLGITGILLNQSVSLGLDASRVNWTWLINMYGLHAEAPKSGFLADGHWLVPTIEKTVFDGRPLQQQIPSPLGLVAVEQFGESLLYVASAEGLVLLSPQGEVFEQISAFNLPVATIRRIGVAPGQASERVVIQDLDAFSTTDGISWQPLQDSGSVSWAKASQLPDRVQQQVLPYVNPSVPWEQVLIDLHSGRLFGSVGPWVINAVGLATVVLSVSGCWMIWLSSRRRRRNTAP